MYVYVYMHIHVHRTAHANSDRCGRVENELDMHMLAYMCANVRVRACVHAAEHYSVRLARVHGPASRSAATETCVREWKWLEHACRQVWAGVPLTDSAIVGLRRVYA